MFGLEGLTIPNFDFSGEDFWFNPNSGYNYDFPTGFKLPDNIPDYVKTAPAPEPEPIAAVIAPPVTQGPALVLPVIVEHNQAREVLSAPVETFEPEIVDNVATIAPVSEPVNAAPIYSAVATIDSGNNAAAATSLEASLPSAGLLSKSQVDPFVMILAGGLLLLALRKK